VFSGGKCPVINRLSKRIQKATRVAQMYISESTVNLRAMML